MSSGEKNSSIKRIDINCDLGEGTNKGDCRQEALLMPYISSCNIACGGHAGNQDTILSSLINASKHKLKVGAHPGYADQENFGRVSVSISQSELVISLKQQIDRLIFIAKKNDIKVNHIKFHGALYNDIEKDVPLAIYLAEFCRECYPLLRIIGLADGNLKKACRRLSLDFISEGFMDRTYLSNGKLSARKAEGAVLEKSNDVVNQALQIADKESVTTIDNNVIPLKVDSICLHGDNPNALVIARLLQQELEKKRFKIQ